MPSRRQLPLLGVILGTVLLTGAVLAVPSGFYPEYEYQVKQVTMDDEAFVYGWATRAPEVLTCNEGNTALACTFERRVRDQGTIIRNESVRGQYTLVYFEDETNTGTYYQVAGTKLSNGTYAHTLEPVGPREALSIASLDADRLHPELTQVLEYGEVKSTTSLQGWEVWEHSEYHIVEYDGRYYRQDESAYYGSRRHVELFVRFLVGAIGAGLLAVSVDKVHAQ